MFGRRARRRSQINLQGPNLAELRAASPTRRCAPLRDVPGLVELKSTLEEPQARVGGGRGPRAGRAASGCRSAQVGARAAAGAGGREGRRLGGRRRAGARRGGAAGARVPHLARRIWRGVPVATGAGRPAHRAAGDGAARAGGARCGTAARPAQIDRRDLERVATIEGNYQGRPLTDVVARHADAAERDCELPPGYRVRLRRRAGGLRRDGGLHGRVAGCWPWSSSTSSWRASSAASSSRWRSCCRCRCRWSA